MSFDLRAAGLPDPLDTEATTCLVAGNAYINARTIHLNDFSTSEAIAGFLYRADIVAQAHRMAFEGGDGVRVIDSGDEEEFAWSIQNVHVPGVAPGTPATFYVFEWTDGVAQDEIQLLSCEEDAYEFLDALRAVVKEATGLAERWREDVPVANGDVSVTLQVMMTLKANGDYELTTPYRYAGVDLDFATTLSVNGVDYALDNGRYLPDGTPDDVARLWERITRTPQPRLDFLALPDDIDPDPQEA